MTTTELAGLFVFIAGITADLAVKIVTNWKYFKPTSYQYLPFTRNEMKETVAVDCTHPTCPQITHHLKAKGQKSLIEPQNRGDSSTDGVLNSILAESTMLKTNQFVTTNHFDVDSFLALWCVLNPALAVKYEKFLRETAKIGDFRELSLNEEWQVKALQLACWLNSEERRLFFKPFEGKGYRLPSSTAVVNLQQQISGAQINSQNDTDDIKSPVDDRYTDQEHETSVDELPVAIENEDTGAEMNGGDRDENNKLYYFLPLFQWVLETIVDSSSNTCDTPIHRQLKEEFETVLYGYNLLHDNLVPNSFNREYTNFVMNANKTNNARLQSSVEKYPQISLVVLKTPQPLHYYSSFSVTRGYDLLLCQYDCNRYELEVKYTSYVDINSRGCLPRVELKYLVKCFNKIEHEEKVKHQQRSQSSDGAELVTATVNGLDYDLRKQEVEFEWRADKVTDSGPILRLDPVNVHLTKSERYGHPYERPIYSSFISPHHFQRIIISFYTFAYREAIVKKDWEWSEILEFNRVLSENIDDWSLASPE